MDKEDNILSFIRSIPDITQLSTRAHILLVGYYLHESGQEDFSLTILKNYFLKSRLPYPQDIPSKLNELLKGDQPPLMPVKKNKYALSIHGDREIQTYLKNKPQVLTGIEKLQDLLPKIINNTQQEFLKDAILCAVNTLRRPAIVMTWLFVMDHMQEYVIKNKLKEFNSVLFTHPGSKVKKIDFKDDFSDLKESLFIEVMRLAKIITKNERTILDNKLGTRNMCAHPAQIIIRDSKVIDFIEDLIDNVVQKYHI